MNFKILIILLFFIFSSSCGVKGPPKAPPGTEITPWLKSYLPDEIDDDSSSDIKKIKAE